MSINNVKETINKEKPWSGLATALHTSEAMMGLSALKQYINIKNLKMPSMNYTHYVRFVRHPQVVLEWLLNCNFFPLWFTGNTTDAEEALNAQFFLQNLDDDVEGLTERYLVQNHDMDAYKALLPVDRVTPHMVLDFRGLGIAADKVGHDVVEAYIQDVCQYVKKAQDKLEKFGDKWDIEKHHNPMITVLTDDDNQGLCLFLTDDMQRVHQFECYQCAHQIDWGWGTQVRTFVRVYQSKDA
ncbi:hypothetical protein ACRXCV_00075 (plasmid) [Halobacteriovorax sp. GFR7]|uniref:hypothetical protein n=1 Tax=unclassified Halobacteriovorax TaxID=2639665 RepID=UPI003D9639F0